VGTYQVRFLKTGPGAVPYTCSQGTFVIEAVDDFNGVFSVDAYYSNGEHDVRSTDCSVGPGNEFHLDDDIVADGIICLDTNLIFMPEYRYENPPIRTSDDWLGGVFGLAQPTAATTTVLHDWNKDGIVSIVGDVPPFVDCVYFGGCPGDVDAIAIGDCNGDGILSIVGDVPCFADCVYFGDCTD
jgi:hypothetical protein